MTYSFRDSGFHSHGIDVLNSYLSTYRSSIGTLGVESG